jgi:lipopolysaccharide biosynthesis regulator YciM
MNNECPCCLLEYANDLSNLRRVPLHNWIQVDNLNAIHYCCYECYYKIVNVNNKCPHCRISLMHPEIEKIN